MSNYSASRYYYVPENRIMGIKQTFWNPLLQLLSAVKSLYIDMKIILAVQKIV